MTSKNKQPFTDKLTWFFFAAIIVGLYLFALGVPLLGPDEPRYSQVAREMFERGDLITTTLGGFSWFEKPALLYWLQIVGYKVFGVNEFAARIGSALFGLGTILSLWLLGRNYQNNYKNSPKEQPSGPALSNWLAIVAASSIGLLAFSRGASFEIIITFPITVSLVGFFLFEQSIRTSKVSSYIPLVLFYAFIGVALIAKGLIGALFPFAIAIFYYVLRRKMPSKAFLISLLWGSILSIAVASIWYLPMYLENGKEFIDEFFIRQHFERFTSNNYRHPGPFWYFLVVLPAMTIPWLPLFLISVWNLIKEKITQVRSSAKDKGDARIENYELRLFALAWILVPLVFFSLSGSKLPGYMLPALPAAVILTAEYIFRFVGNNTAKKYTLQGVALLTFVVVAFILEFILPGFALQDSTKGIVQTANQNGYQHEKILNLYTISHNLEFYGANRLVRESDGKQKRFNGVREIVEHMQKNNAETVLVVVPHEYLAELNKSNLVDPKVLDKNAELTIVAVSNKRSYEN